MCPGPHSARRPQFGHPWPMRIVLHKSHRSGCLGSFRQFQKIVLIFTTISYGKNESGFILLRFDWRGSKVVSILVMKSTFSKTCGMSFFVLFASVAQKHEKGDASYYLRATHMLLLVHTSTAIEGEIMVCHSSLINWFRSLRFLEWTSAWQRHFSPLLDHITFSFHSTKLKSLVKLIGTVVNKLTCIEWNIFHHSGRISWSSGETLGL